MQKEVRSWRRVASEWKLDCHNVGGHDECAKPKSTYSQCPQHAFERFIIHLDLSREIVKKNKSQVTKDKIEL